MTGGNLRIERDAPIVKNYAARTGWVERLFLFTLRAQVGLDKMYPRALIRRGDQEQSRDRMDGGWKHYSRMTPPKTLTDTARKLSENELKERLDHSKKMTQINYDKSGQSPYKKRRPSIT